MNYTIHQIKDKVDELVNIDLVRNPNENSIEENEILIDIKASLNIVQDKLMPTAIRTVELIQILGVGNDGNISVEFGDRWFQRHDHIKVYDKDFPKDKTEYVILDELNKGRRESKYRIRRLSNEGSALTVRQKFYKITNYED